MTTGMDVAGRALLEGMRVVEGATFIAGPTAGLTLAQLGADVIRIDPIGGAADTRRRPLSPEGTSLYWTGLNKRKRSVAIDLASARGRSLVTELVLAAGVFVTNAPGRPWPEDAALRAVRPDLVYLHLLGRSDGTPSIDYTINSRTGLPLLTGPRDEPGPVNHVLPAWDLVTGLYAATGLLAADRHRRRTGEGRYVRLAMSDVALATMGNIGYLAEAALGGAYPGRERDGNFVYGTFGVDLPTADGRGVMVVALTPRHWRGLVAVTGTGERMAELERRHGVDLADEDDRFALRRECAAVLRPWFEARPAAAARDALVAAGVLCEVYQSLEELVATDPEYLAGELFADVEQPGVGTVRVPGTPLRHRNAPAPAPAPFVGQHTREVLGELLGLASREIDDLHDTGVVSSGHKSAAVI